MEQMQAKHYVWDAIAVRRQSILRGMMHESKTSPPRSRRLVLAWMVLTALVLLVVGLYVQVPAWMVILWVAIPLVCGLLLLVLSGRTTTPEGAYSITSHSARSEGLLVVEAPVEHVMQIVPDAVAGLPRFTLVELGESGAELGVKATMKTWGERITLDFRRLTPDRTEVRARCEPTVGATLVDYGQGAKDLRLLLEEIEQRVSGGREGLPALDESPPSPPHRRWVRRKWDASSKASKGAFVVVSYLAFLVVLALIGYTVWGDVPWVPLVGGLVVFLLPLPGVWPRRSRDARGRHGDQK